MSDLPDGWSVARLGDLADTSLGKMLDAARPKGTSPVPYLRNLNVQWGHIDLDDVQTVPLSDDEITRFALEAGDLLVCEGGDIGRAALWQGQREFMVYQKALHRVRGRGGLDMTYLRYLLEHYAHRGMLRARATGSTILHLPQRQLRELPIPHPSIREQRRIVEILEDHLSRSDRAVDLLDRCRTRAAGLQSGTYDRLLRGSSATSSEFKGVVRRVPLTDLADLISGPAFKSAYFGGPGEGTPLLRGDNIEPGQLRWDRTRTWPDDLLKGHEHLFVEDRDIILAMDRPVISNGLKLAIARTEDLPCLLVQRVARIRCRSGVLPEFVLFVLRSRAFLRHLRLNEVGTQLPHITLKAIGSFEVPLLSPEDQARVVDEARAVIDQTDRLTSSVLQAESRAGRLRQTLLAAAFAGRLSAADTTGELANV